MNNFGGENFKMFEWEEEYQEDDGLMDGDLIEIDQGLRFENGGFDEVEEQGEMLLEKLDQKKKELKQTNGTNEDYLKYFISHIDGKDIAPILRSHVIIPCGVKITTDQLRNTEYDIIADEERKSEYNISEYEQVFLVIFKNLDDTITFVVISNETESYLFQINIIKHVLTENSVIMTAKKYIKYIGYNILRDGNKLLLDEYLEIDFKTNRDLKKFLKLYSNINIIIPPNIFSINILIFKLIIECYISNIVLNKLISV